MISAYAVMDSVNKYRHGVLLGNYVEDKFGNDLADKGPNPDSKKISTTKQHFDPSHSLYRGHPVLKDQEERQSSLQQTAKSISQNNYQKPETATTYEIFHRQEVNKQVPLLNNNPKKEQKMDKDGTIYENTRYHLANKFQPLETSMGSSNKTMENLRETGNIYDVNAQQIPDILTGEIWKTSKEKPDAETKTSSRHTGQPITKIQVPARPKSLNPHGTTSLIKPEIQKFEEADYKKNVFHHERGENHNILFGHGLEVNEFHRNQLGTTYDLSFNQKVKPQTQVNSFYNVDANQSAKKYHRDTLLQKNYQSSIPEFGNKGILSNQKWGRPYDPYTKTFDKNHLKNQYLRK